MDKMFVVELESMGVKTKPGSKKNLKAAREITIQRPEREKLTPEESLERMNEFDKRKDKFIAAIRKSKD